MAKLESFSCCWQFVNNQWQKGATRHNNSQHFGRNALKCLIFCSGRKIYFCSVRVPREEMRTFLEACEEPVYTTGDQSLAEAMWMGKVPCVKPDAKVQQWHLALMAKVSGAMDKVPDLGAELRKLATDESAQKAAIRQSKERSEACEQQIIAQLGCPPNQWNPTQQVLARSGMLG
eukprot:symbB.v1.2.019769.t1/scaffold1596.1/size109882/8